MKEVIVKKIKDESLSIRKYELINIDNSDFSAYEAGSHIDIKTPSGHIRQYSLCGDPDVKNTISIAVKKDENSRGGSVSLHDNLKVGDRVLISMPKCHFRLSSETKHHVLIGAGVGITPLISMAYECLRLGNSFELHYFVREDDKSSFLDFFGRKEISENTNIYSCSDRQKIKSILSDLTVGLNNHNHVYTCGPNGFMEEVVYQASKIIPKEQIHFEYFNGVEIDESENQVFNVILGSSGKKITVSEDETLVMALNRNGVNVPVSCQEGTCGTCLIPVISGDIIHRDVFLTEDEKKEGEIICACVSRGKNSDLVLDL